MAEPAPAELHPDVAALAPLLGSWSGRGRGEYPTIEPFEFAAELVFSHIGKPFLVHTQRTRHLGTGLPSHTETGYWRVPGVDADGRLRVELILAQPTGVAEVHGGLLDGGSIELRTTTVARSGSAKEVTAVERAYRLDGDVLHYRMAMAAVGQPLTHHLESVLRRVPPEEASAGGGGSGERPASTTG
jgi:hypothetical protein